MPWEGDSHFKKSGMLVASLRGIQDKMPLFLAVKVSFSVAREEIIKTTAVCSAYSGTFKGLLELETRQVLSLLGA